MSKTGILVVVSGFSGAGKGTLMKALLSQYSQQYALSISATTRKPRQGEVHGQDYFFKEMAEFEKMIAEKQLIEYAKYVENYYGTPRAYVDEQLSQGKDVILEIEIQGALDIKAQHPEALLIFVTTPNAQELKRRLVSRGTESMAVIESRMNRAADEALEMDSYDYLVINDDLQSCVEGLHRIIQGEHARSFRNKELIKEIQQELRDCLKGEA